MAYGRPFCYESNDMKIAKNAINKGGEYNRTYSIFYNIYIELILSYFEND